VTVNPDFEANYGLVMPFVATTSHGGPYDDAAFVAGFEAGWLDLMLSITGKVGAEVQRYVPPELVPQLDLIGMRHGYKLIAEPWDEHPDEWTLITFEAAAGSATLQEDT
jgi:hypothetical protein